MSDDNNSNNSKNNPKEEEDDSSGEFNGLDEIINYAKVLNRKRRREENPTDIIYNANKKKLINCFCPNPKELNDFLDKCEIREIKDAKEIDNIPSEKIFDPIEFIIKNFDKEKNKTILTFEDISNIDSKEENKSSENIINEEESSLQEPSINDKIELSENKTTKSIPDKNQLIQTILNNDILNQNQKDELNKLILQIKNTDISNILKENDKLDIVFDLDETCISAVIIGKELLKELNSKNVKKDLKFYRFEFGGKILFACLTIRNGLKEFFNFAKKFCNFYISTLGADPYGRKIKEILEYTYKIKFINFQAKDEKIGNKKLLESLKLNPKFTLIFDDKPQVWIYNYSNVIVSKIFLDKEINKFIINKNKINKNIDLMNILIFSFDLIFYKPEKNKYNQIEWKKQKLFSRKNPFYSLQENNKDSYSAEYLDSTKNQFIYMKDVIKIIYFFMFNYKISISYIIKLIRYNIFFKAYFSLKFYKGVLDGKNNIKDIIETCGGQVLEDDINIKFDQNDKLFFICRNDEYPKLKDKIQKELRIYQNSKLVNDKFILDSFYFMTNLENELDSSEYSPKVGNEDEYDY